MVHEPYITCGSSKDVTDPLPLTRATFDPGFT